MLEVYSGSGGVKRGKEPLFFFERERERRLSGQLLTAQTKPWALKAQQSVFFISWKNILKNIYDLLIPFRPNMWNANIQKVIAGDLNYDGRYKK